MLESLGDIYGKINDHWRGRGFTKAAAVLRGLKMEITQVQRLKVRLICNYWYYSIDNMLVLSAKSYKDLSLVRATGLLKLPRRPLYRIH